MEWTRIWRTIFCGWDGDIDLVALAREIAAGAHALGNGEEHDVEATEWLRRQMQGVY
jgi:hypothetical protein